MRRRINEDTLIYAAASFLLPVFVLLILLPRASVNIMAGVDLQMADVDELRYRMSAGSIFVPDVLSDVLTRRFYPSFILSLLIGGSAGKFILKLFFYVRFGMLSAGMYYWCTAHVRLNRLHGLLTGLFYSLCAVSLTACTIPQVMNVMIVMPLALSACDTLLRRGTRRALFAAAGVLSLFAAGGFEGIVTGIIFAACVLWILSGLIREAKVTSGVKALLMSLVFELPVLIPVICSGTMLIDIKEEFKNSTVTFKVFDMLCSGLDGTPVNIPEAGSFVTLGITVLVTAGALLFFINRNVPYKSRLAAAVCLIAVTVSMSWSLFGAVLSVFDVMNLGVFMRTGVLCVLLFLISSISWRNVGSLTPNAVYGAAAILFAFIVIANSSSASEVSRSVFAIWFSAGAVLFWIMVLFMMMKGKDKAVSACLVLGMLGMGINVFYGFKVSGFDGKVSESRLYGTSGSTLSVQLSGDFPLYGDRAEYLLVRSDLRKTSADTFPERVNMLTNSALLGDVLSRADAFTVFTSGISDDGNGLYHASAHGVPYEILLRCENMNPDDAYYVYTTFDGSTTLSETFGQEETVNVLEGPFVRMLTRKADAVTLRLVGTTSADSEEFSVWRADSQVLEDLRSCVSPMEGYEALIGGESGSSYSSYMTVVTSVPYGENYDIRVTGAEGRVPTETFGYAGRLAAAFQGDGSADYMVKVTSSAIVPAVSVTVWVLSAGFVIYNVIRRQEKTGVVTDAQQEN